MTVLDGIDYGPLACLVGQWEGDEGMDISPESDGTEQNPYFETMLFEACGDVTNAEDQKLSILRYHQVVCRKTTSKVFHNETGYLTWDSRSGIVTQSFVIPRGIAVVAGGTGEMTGSVSEISVAAAVDDPDYGISQAPYMRDNAKTLSFSHVLRVEQDSLSYQETTVLDIYGGRFEHTDRNTLKRSG